ncbi:hypothetical protein ACQPU1_14960 [Clostridium paraputrificum]|uniref:hypothetical protein n=1 Tax=Clostridium TaxID=1485 RepID=UPI003D33C856
MGSRNIDVLASKDINKVGKVYLIEEKIEGKGRLAIQFYDSVGTNSFLRGVDKPIDAIPDKKGNVVEYLFSNYNGQFFETITVFGKIIDGEKIQIICGEKELNVDISEQKYFIDTIDISEFNISQYDEVKIKII